MEFPGGLIRVDWIWWFCTWWNVPVGSLGGANERICIEGDSEEDGGNKTVDLLEIYVGLGERGDI